MLRLSRSLRGGGATLGDQEKVSLILLAANRCVWLLGCHRVVFNSICFLIALGFNRSAFLVMVGI